MGTTPDIALEQEFVATRATLKAAGLPTALIDSLHDDYLRLCTHEPLARRRVVRNSDPDHDEVAARVLVLDVNQWWACHLALFRKITEPDAVAARARLKTKLESSLVRATAG
ncbi:MAG: hypothetical protein ACLQU2_23255 [Candidatus Binataceae bacterium]